MATNEPIQSKLSIRSSFIKECSNCPAKEYECLIKTSQMLLYLAMSRILLRGLTPSLPTQDESDRPLGLRDRIVKESDIGEDNC